MRCEAPDSHFFAELRDLNLAFLSLAVTARQVAHGPVFGLDGVVLEGLARLGPAQLETVALVPCLLAAFTTHAGRAVLRAAEPSPVADGAWLEQARLFTAGLLTYLRQAVHHDPLRAALCVGRAGWLPVPEARGRDIRAEADGAMRHLEARFRACDRFWPDLVRAARDGNPERLKLARLTAIQLATVETRSVPPGAIVASAPALALVR